MTTATHQTYDWASRYGERWSEIARQTENLQTVNGKVVCAWCGEHFDHRDTQVHHAHYSLDGKTLLKDDVVPLRDAFAVCGTADTPGTCHHALHQHPLWIQDTDNRVAGDRNNDDVIYQLIQNTRQFREATPMTTDLFEDNTRQETTRTQSRRHWRDRIHRTANRGQDLYEESWIMRLVSWVLVSGLIAALGYVSWLNIAPYVALVKMLGFGTPNWIEGLPLIGWMVQTWSGLIVTIVGVMVWSLVQALQCLWLLVSLDKKALHGAVHQAQVGRYQLSGQTDGIARAITRKANRIPYFFIRWAPVLSLGAYAFDLAVGLSLYPPAASLNAFLFALSSGMFSAIDLGNLIKLLVMLFAFELVLVLLIFAWQWTQSRQAAPTQSAL